MKFEPTPLPFSDCIKEQNLSKSLYIPNSIVNKTIDSIRDSYSNILEGIKKIHENKDIFYFNDPIFSRVYSLLFILVNFSNDITTTQPQECHLFFSINNHQSKFYFTPKPSYDVQYNEQQIITTLKKYIPYLDTIDNVFYFPLQSTTKTKIAWL